MVSLTLRRGIEWERIAISGDGRARIRNAGSGDGAATRVDAPGFEPGASPLQGERSTTDLRAREGAIDERSSISMIRASRRENGRT